MLMHIPIYEKKGGVPYDTFCLDDEGMTEEELVQAKKGIILLRDDES